MKSIIAPKKLVMAISLLIGVGLVVSIGMNSKRDQSRNNRTLENSRPKQNTQTITPFDVKVTQVERKDLAIRLRSYGIAVAKRKITVKAGISGLVISLPVKESEMVKKGHLLVEMDAREHRLEVERIEAERLKSLSHLYSENGLDIPVSLFESTEKIQKKSLSTEQEYALIESGRLREEILAAKNNFTQTEINLKKARMLLEKTKIKALFSGIITDIKISPMEYVSAGQELFTLVDVTSIQVHASILESEIRNVNAGNAVDLCFSAYPKDVFSGKVQAVSPIVRTEERTCKVIIDVVDPSKKIKPGMHAEVKIVSKIHPMRLLVPQDAVLVRSGKALVFVVHDGLAKWRYVTLGLENSKSIEILAGVKEGEQVIVDNHFTLGHDSAVRIIR